MKVEKTAADQVLSVRVRVMKRALPSFVSPKPDSTMSITSFTTGSFSFMPRVVAATRDSRPKSFMVVPKKRGSDAATRRVSTDVQALARVGLVSRDGLTQLRVKLPGHPTPDLEKKPVGCFSLKLLPPNTRDEK